jgi:glycosyltransferase involved in cell wall biosynthesis
MISVIIPSFRPQNYIYDCLNSLLAQTLTVDLFELIIIINGDKEPYHSNITSFLANTGINYKVCFSEIKGVSNARNLGMEISKGDYVVFIDDDDFVSLNYLESLYSKRNENSIVVTNFYNFHDDNLLILHSDYLTKSFQKRSNSNLFNNRSFFSSACAKIIPKSVIENHIFNININIGEDALFMAEISKNINSVLFTEKDVIYYRRIRTNSASRGNQSIKSAYINMMKLNMLYIIMYFKSPLSYNIPFLLTRPFAVVKNFILFLIKKLK